MARPFLVAAAAWRACGDDSLAVHRSAEDRLQLAKIAAAAGMPAEMYLKHMASRGIYLCYVISYDYEYCCREPSACEDEIWFTYNYLRCCLTPELVRQGSDPSSPTLYPRRRTKASPRNVSRIFRPSQSNAALSLASILPAECRSVLVDVGFNIGFIAGF